MNGLSSLLLLTTLAAAPAPPPSQEDGTYKQLEGVTVEPLGWASAADATTEVHEAIKRFRASL